MKQCKFLSWMMAIAIAILTFTACSDDEEETMTVHFQLLNEAGAECYKYQEDDNIIFRLRIDNNTDNATILPSVFEIIGTDIFSIYSAKGEYIGTPWDELFGNSSGKFVIESNSSAVILCPWLDAPSLGVEGHENYYSGCFSKTEKKLALPKGEYYSKFDISLKTKTKSCYRTFVIE